MFRVVLLLVGLFSLGNTEEVHENSMKHIEILKLLMRIGGFLPSEDDEDEDWDDNEDEDEEDDNENETTTQVQATTTENNSCTASGTGRTCQLITCANIVQDQTCDNGNSCCQV